MKVKDLIKMLREYNQEAEFEVIVDGQIPCSISLSYGGPEGVTKEYCSTVDIIAYINNPDE